MPIKTLNMGPGTFTVGDGPLAVEAQLRNLRIEWSENVASTDPVPVLSGEERAGSEKITFSSTIAGRLFQDIEAAGIVDWSWTHKGTEQPFTFVPNTAKGRQIVGVCKPVPITIGGDVTGTADRPGDPAESDFSWRCKDGDDEPILSDFDPA